MLRKASIEQVKSSAYISRVEVQMLLDTIIAMENIMQSSTRHNTLLIENIAEHTEKRKSKIFLSIRH